MRTLTITVSDESWPVVAAVLSAAYGPVPDGVSTAVWANQVAAQVFSDRIAELMEPPPPKGPPMRRIRPSRVHA